jgi:CP family cyanate transporter-like MFS transporter
MQSCLYYGVTAWLVSVYVERGWASADASVLLSVVNMASLASIVVVPMASRRGLSRRKLLATAASLATIGLLGVALVPGPAFLWAAVLGPGLGMSFTLVLTLPADIGRDAREVGGAAALMLLVGYLIAAAAPFVLGAARDVTGDFGASVWLLVLIAALMLPLALTLSPNRLRPGPASPAGA